MGTPRPRFLGRAKGADAFHELHCACPGLHPDDSEMKGVSGQGRFQFETKLEDIWKWNSRAKLGSNKSEQNRKKRITAHMTWGHSVKRVQRYLGIRPKAGEGTSGIPISLNLRLPMPNVAESVVFVAIDVEWFEFNSNLITEVGLAVLDTFQTMGVAPTENLEQWFRMIKSRHLRVKENAHAVNRVHVRGREAFFNFGFVLRASRPR